jgi:hypothetical protein
MKTFRSKPVTIFALALLAACLARHLTFTLAGAKLSGRDLPQLGKRSTHVETVEASKVRNDKFYQGPNFLKVLVQLGDLDSKYPKDNLKALTVGSTQFKLSPTGQYFGFGHIGEKVLIISGEEPDILGVVLKLFPPNNKGLVSLRLLVPKVSNSPLFADNGKQLGDLRQTLTKLHLNEGLPIDEVLVEVVGEPFKAYDAVKWFLNLANGEQLKQETRQLLSVVHKDMNRNLSNEAEILIPMTVKQSGIIIGKGGAALEKLRSKLKVFVDVQGRSEAKDGKVTVTLKGPIGSVHEAHLEIQRLVAVAEKESPQDTSERGA